MTAFTVTTVRARTRSEWPHSANFVEKTMHCSATKGTQAEVKIPSYWRWEQLRHFAEVLGCCCQCELVFRSIWSSEA